MTMSRFEEALVFNSLSLIFCAVITILITRQKSVQTTS